MTKEREMLSSGIGMTDGQKLIVMLETFLGDNYQIRRNVVNDAMEYRKILHDGTVSKWFSLDNSAFNAMVLEARKSGIDGSIRQVMQEMVYSSDVEQFNPVRDYLDNLPEWDGKDREEGLFNAIPGISSEMVYYCCRWFRSCVAHWCGMDLLYGNQSVLTLIGAQGCGKSTFAQRLLPPELRHLFLDHINLSNKNDKEMALSNNMIVNIDELDQVTNSQQAALKQLLTKSRVNGRKIYGRSQVMRERMASFVATTNNRHPLKDPTGSRRFLCINIPDGKVINNTLDIDYQQLMAQALHEVKEEKMPYWFNDDEVKRIQQLNTMFYADLSFEKVVGSMVRKPEENEECRCMTSCQLLDIISLEYPGIQVNRSLQTRLGVILSDMGIERNRSKSGYRYKVVVK